MKSKQATECALKFCLQQNKTKKQKQLKTKQTGWRWLTVTFFVASMSQREGIYGSASNFSLSSNFGFKTRVWLGNWFTALARLPHGATTWEKVVMACLKNKKIKKKNKKNEWLEGQTDFNL